MKGMAECLFVGGPGGEEVLTLPAIQCRDRLSVEQDGWLEARADGGANVMRGPRPRNANWESYTRFAYEKDTPAVVGRVTYRFQGVETVNRCGEILALKNRRCQHEALAGQKYCRQHQKN
jgi:hypothetical protein